MVCPWDPMRPIPTQRPQSMGNHKLHLKRVCLFFLKQKSMRPQMGARCLKDLPPPPLTFSLYRQLQHLNSRAKGMVKLLLNQPLLKNHQLKLHHFNRKPPKYRPLNLLHPSRALLKYRIFNLHHFNRIPSRSHPLNLLPLNLPLLKRPRSLKKRKSLLRNGFQKVGVRFNPKTSSMLWSASTMCLS